jgi:hypothetical protein
MTAFYDVGTISVTNGSAVVTGSGTAWVGVLRAGWLIKMPNGEMYGIAQVISATEIQLQSAYSGTNQTGQSYLAVNTGGVSASLVSSLLDLTGDVQAMLDGPGSGKFVDGTLAQPGIVFTADQDTGLRRVSSNTIALTTGGVDRAVIGPNGMTGPAVQSSPTDTTAGRLLTVGAAGVALGADVYRRANILGTVSQTGGVPTGAIIEGPITNANGTYIRWADGTQICMVSANLGSIVANGAGTFADPYRTAGANLGWPAVFAAGTTPVAACVGCVPDASTSEAERLAFGVIRGVDRAAARQCHVVRLGGATTVQDGWLDIIAIGRWF